MSAEYVSICLVSSTTLIHKNFLKKIICYGTRREIYTVTVPCLSGQYRGQTSSSKGCYVVQFNPTLWTSLYYKQWSQSLVQVFSLTNLLDMDTLVMNTCSAKVTIVSVVRWLNWIFE